MPQRSDQGCNAPSRDELVAVHKHLVELLAPRIHFHSKEKSFQVDLPSTIKRSSLLDRHSSSEIPSTANVWMNVNDGEDIEP